jgi:hypothetical protein
VEAEVGLGEALLHLGEDAVGEDHGGVVAGGARFADRLDEAELGAAVGGEVLDQEDAGASGTTPSIRALRP